MVQRGELLCILALQCGLQLTNLLPGGFVHAWPKQKKMHLNQSNYIYVNIVNVLFISYLQ